MFVNGVYKSYKSDNGLNWKSAKIEVLNDFSLELRKGEILGIMGRSGIGKSTLAKLIAGMEPFNKGDILFQGISLNKMDKTARLEYFRAIQLIPQDPLSRMPPHRTMRTLYDDVYFIKGRQYDSAEISSLFQSLGLHESLLDRLPSELSGGQRQRILIGRALLMEVKLLICDEIFSSLDPENEAEIGALLKNLNVHKRLSIIMISHDKKSLDRLCNRVCLLYTSPSPRDGLLSRMPSSA